MKSARSVFFVFLFFVLFVPKVLAASAGDVVINEVVTDPQQDWSTNNFNGILASGTVSDVDEWVELFIKKDLDLTNWTIELLDGSDVLGNLKDNGAFQTTKYFGGGSFTNTRDGDFLVLGNVKGSGTMNNDIQIVLKEGANIIDSVTLGNLDDGNKTDNAPFGNADSSVDEVVARDQLGTDTNNDSSDFRKASATLGSLNNPFSTPTSTPIPTPTPTPTPTATPTATPVPTAQPTPTVTHQISFLMPSDVQIGQLFDSSVLLSSFNANTLYYIKALIGKDSSSMTDGRTLGSDGVTWLAWNASWSKMPSIQTDNAGSATAAISVKTDDDIEPGSYQMVIRVKEANGTESVDSGAKTINVSAPVNSAVLTATPVPTPKSTSSSSKSGSGKTQGSIKTIKQLSDGSAIETEGLVSVPFGVLGSNYFYLDDGEAGIMVKSEKKIDLKLGQRIKVASTIEESYGEKYIKTSGVTIINNSINPPIPKSARGNQIGEDLEGKLISVSGRIFETSGNVFWINDGFGDVKIYIKDSTGIKIARKKVGDYVKIIGILSQWGFDDDEKPNFRLLPRFQSDVVISGAPIGGVGQVLGAVALPKTGVSLSELPGAIWQALRSHLLRKAAVTAAVYPR